MQPSFGQLQLPGRLIAVEGPDGCGKTTQIQLLRRWLEKQGLKVFCSEWSSSDLITTVTGKGPKRTLLTPTTYSLIHATDFADRYERQLVPLLRAGYLVLCDRYVFTAFARDSVRGCPASWVRGLYDFAALPDLVFYLNANLEIILDRVLVRRPRLDYFESGMDLDLARDRVESFRVYQGRLMDEYLALSSEFGFFMIDGNQAIEQQQAVMQTLVSHHIPLDLHRGSVTKPARRPSRRPARTPA